MRCSVCSHAKRAAIEAACAKGTSGADVAARFELSERGLERHVTLHAVIAKKPSSVSLKRAAARTTDRSPPGATRARPRAPTPPAAAVEEPEEPSPATSRSPTRVSARSKLDDLLEHVDAILD